MKPNWKFRKRKKEKFINSIKKEVISFVKLLNKIESDSATVLNGGVRFTAAVRPCGGVRLE